jgi:chemotaxis protein CheD
MKFSHGSFLLDLRKDSNVQTVMISDRVISQNPSDVLITYALGSCLGLTIYDPELKIGAMAHFMLPNSTLDPIKSKAKPFMFVDSGLTIIMQELLNLGCAKKRLIVKASGCAQAMDKKEIFNIGKRNFSLLRKFLWKNSMVLDSFDTGGDQTRTMILHISDGKTVVKTNEGLKEM